MRQQHNKSQNNASPYDLSLWRYMYKARQPAEELAYREHFLDNDIRQLAVSYYAIALLLIAMTIVDLSRLAEEPARVNGIAIKIIFVFMGLGVARIVAIMRQAKVMDLCALLYTAVFAMGILFTHASNDYSGVRIAALIVVFIYTAHIAFPVYVSYLLPAMAILIVGEMVMIFVQDRADLVLDRPIILIAFLFCSNYVDDCIILTSSGEVQYFSRLESSQNTFRLSTNMCEL